MTRTARTLLTGLIDYAGLYPPAKLGIQAAVEEFARGRGGEYEWMLGRFVCPASRLEELSRAGAPLMPGTHATSGYRERADIGEPWRVSVVVDGDLGGALDAIGAFNERHAREDGGLASADVIELRVDTPDLVDGVLDRIPDDLYPFFEGAAGADPRGLITALAGTMCAAKIRTGGVTQDSFPTAGALSAFISACAGADVPFKATAGLHHPVRGEHPLTYERGCPNGTMHGFLNVFLAAGAARLHRAGVPVLTAMLEVRDAAEFKFTDEGVRWRDFVMEPAQIAKVREAFALSFGSCSFSEPVEGLEVIGIL